MLRFLLSWRTQQRTTHLILQQENLSDKSIHASMGWRNPPSTITEFRYVFCLKEILNDHCLHYERLVLDMSRLETKQPVKKSIQTNQYAKSLDYIWGFRCLCYKRACFGFFQGRGTMMAVDKELTMKAFLLCCLIVARP